MYITKKLLANQYFECMYITKKLSGNKYFKSLTEELTSGGFRDKYFDFDFNEGSGWEVPKIANN